MDVERDKDMIEIDDMEQLIIDSMGEAEALDAITRALSYDQKKEVYEYIIRCYDLKNDDETGD